MKKTSIYCLIIILLISSITFADKNQEIKDNDMLLETAEEISNTIDKMKKREAHINDGIFNKNQEIKDNDMLLETAEEISDIIDEMKKREAQINDNTFIDNQEIEDNDMYSAETMFVTGIEGEWYKNYEDIPRTIRYSYHRSSDGAMFIGTLSAYYVKAQVFFDPDNVWWQAWYEGRLTLQYYSQ